MFTNNTEQPKFLEVLSRARLIHFSYCYRIPREAGLLCAALLRQQQPSTRPSSKVEQLRNFAQTMTYGFCSNFIRVIPYDSIATGILDASDEYAQLIASAIKDVAVIFCGNSTTRSLYPTELEQLSGDGTRDGKIFTPRMVKGKEFDYCIVIAPELLFTESGKPQNFGLSTIYVALSRCRYGLSVYTDKETAKLLIHPAVEVHAEI
jgi:hypothetical protein